ncbi:putative response regulatory protein [Desulfuromonas versatilis]|uniref:Response regulatory protein n=1 Tax=Desulfuromonas versatilis TaxID=2802975 RepID=A0ABM8HRZ2_9BACT|nr:two-component system response regulator BtsR [Desulfuromonas versatilis]BCR03229.1 putative response regulatory protein [Desulfuromonas versatilis]
MIRALIVDDELHARKELAKLLEKTGQFELVGQCANAVEAVKAINSQRPDVVFLDIQMPVIDGFEMLSMIDREIMPHVVFVTAYDEYAIRAFEEKTLDYLLKPVHPERLAKTVEKLLEHLISDTTRDYDTAPLTRIPCIKGGNIKLIPAEVVEYAYSDPSGVHVVVAGEAFFTDLTLKALEERTALLRCHRQALVNIDAIDQVSLQEGGGAEIRTHGGQTIPVSRRNLREFKKALGI